jgi:steroid 5-alpha reductase family enzyme
MAHYLFTVSALIFIYMTAWFAVSVAIERNDVADIAWGLGFILVAWGSSALSGAWGSANTVANILVTAWGARLVWHIYQRNHGKPEDSRYRAWRQQWGKWVYPRSYVQVFLLQGLLLLLVATPVLALNRHAAQGFGYAAAMGTVVWVFGFLYESTADAQLAGFTKDPANHGHLLRTGLWRYSRHPNYFGEVTQWWGIWLIALSSPHSWWGIIGPTTITFLILKVSGVPLLEEHMKEKPGFAEYAKATPVLVPWFRKAKNIL